MKRIYLSLILRIILIFVSAWLAYGLINDNPLLWIFITSLAVALASFLVGTCWCSRATECFSLRWRARRNNCLDYRHVDGKVLYWLLHPGVVVLVFIIG